MDPPAKRRGRVFDDAEFFASLRRRVESDRNLTPAQLGALNKIVIKYADRIPDFAAQQESLELGEAGAPAAPDPETEGWLTAHVRRQGILHLSFPPVRGQEEPVPSAEGRAQGHGQALLQGVGKRRDR